MTINYEIRETLDREWVPPKSHRYTKIKQQERKLKTKFQYNCLLTSIIIFFLIGIILSLD